MRSIEETIGKILIGATLGVMLIGTMSGIAHAEDGTVAFKNSTIDNNENIKVIYYLYPTYTCETENMETIKAENPDVEFGMAQRVTIDLETGEKNGIESCYTNKKIMGNKKVIFYAGDMDTSASGKEFLDQLVIHSPSEYTKIILE